MSLFGYEFRRILFVSHCFESMMVVRCLVTEEDGNSLSAFVCLSERLVVGVGKSREYFSQVRLMLILCKLPLKCVT